MNEIASFVPENIRQEIFYPLIDKLSNGLIVEVGTSVGGNLCRIAKYAKEHNKNITFFGIDNFSFVFNSDDPQLTYHGCKGRNVILNSFQTCMDNLRCCNVLDCVKLIAADSIIVSELFQNKTIDLIFLDTTHTYDHVKNEVIAWKNKVKIGGIFAGHDWNMEGVDVAIKEVFSEYNINVTSDGTSFWIQI